MDVRYQQGDKADRINRYIMECKSKKRSNQMALTRELIDTLWNVNRNTCFVNLNRFLN